MADALEARLAYNAALEERVGEAAACADAALATYTARGGGGAGAPGGPTVADLLKDELAAAAGGGDAAGGDEFDFDGFAAGAPRWSAPAAPGEQPATPLPGGGSARRPASPSPPAAEGSGTSALPGEARLRLQKARLRALQDEVAALNRELAEKDRSLIGAEREAKELLAEKAAWAKQEKSLRAALEKARKGGDAAKTALETREREVAEMRRELERASRSARGAENKGQSREVRLNRALEEVERYRKLLEEAREQSHRGADASKREAERLAAENKKLERQKQELLNAFRKQAKLVDVLRKQKVHLEAARMLQFTEEEFVRTLESGPAMP